MSTDMTSNRSCSFRKLLRDTWWYKWNQQRYKEEEERRERQKREEFWVDAPNAAPWRGYTVI